MPRFYGGAVGWLSYDAVRWFERLPSRSPDELGLPELCFALTDTLVIFDNLRGTIKVVASIELPAPAASMTGPTKEQEVERLYQDACRRIDDILERLQKEGPSLRAIDVNAPTVVPNPVSRTPRNRYEDGVRAVQEYIKAGDAFQVVLSQRFEVPRRNVDPFDVYRALRVTNPSPYMFHLEFPEAIVTGASPEIMVRVEDGRIELRPIAGTRKRGRTPAEDAAMETELLTDQKERAEHVMLIDLGRNDVGRVSQPGSVKLDETFVIERYSHVMHIVSNVSGTIASNVTPAEVVRAAFPAGTLSGAPKIRAMEIIEELEPARRGLYGGAVGYFSYGGNVDLAIAIRTLVTKGETINVQAGAGIVADSQPALEFEECQNKARAVITAVEMARTREP